MKAARPLCCLLAVVALLALPLAAQQPATVSVRVQGTVFDSVSKTPLSGASVQLVREDAIGSPSKHATADENGRFELVLTAGRWLVATAHPRFDSIGVTLPTRKVDVPRSTQFRLTLATPSALTLARAYCPAAGAADGVIVGTVRDAADRMALDSVRVTAEWSELTIGAGGVRSARPHATARTDADGWFVLCGVPIDAELAAWATWHEASTGVVALPASSRPITRLDLRIDPTAVAALEFSGDSLDAAPARSPGLERPSLRAGRARFAAVVHDAAGRPVVGARARMLGRAVGLTNASGFVALDALPAGSQTFEVRALGFVPHTATVNVADLGSAPDTVTLLSANALLDTVRVTTRSLFTSDRNGFLARSRNGLGSYITQEQIESRRPSRITDLFWSETGMRVVSNGFDKSVVMTRSDKPCAPTVFIDGAPLIGRNGDLDFLALPGEVSGIEIYKGPASTPPQFYLPSAASCGSIVIWTRARFRVPKKPLDGEP